MNQREFQEELHDLERALDRVRAKYELYFQGLERIEPIRDRERVERGMRQLMRNVPKNTSLKFRFNTFKQRLITLKTYWGRISRQIEEGTYKRHVQRAKKRFGVQEEQKKPVKKVFELNMEADADLDVDALFAGVLGSDDSPKKEVRKTRQRTPGAMPAVPQRNASRGTPQRTSARPPRPANLAQSAKKVSASLPPPKAARATAANKPKPADPYRGVYDSYVEARRKNNQKVDHLRYEAVAKKLQKMVPKLQQKHKGKNIDFEVVVRDGKVGFKPVAKKQPGS